MSQNYYTSSRSSQSPITSSKLNSSQQDENFPEGYNDHDDYVVMSPKSTPSENTKSPIRSHGYHEDVYTDMGMSKESIYADMTGNIGEKLMPSYSPAHSSLLNEKSSSNISVQDKYSRTAGYSNKQKYDDVTDGYAAVNNVVGEQPVHLTSPYKATRPIQHGGYDKDDEGDYDVLEDTIDTQHNILKNRHSDKCKGSPKKLLVNGMRSQSVKHFHKSSLKPDYMPTQLEEDDDYACIPDTFRKRSGGISVNSASAEKPITAGELITGSSTPAGKAAKKYLQMQLPAEKDDHHSSEMKRSSSTGIIRSSSRVGKSGGVQTRINRVKQHHSFKQTKTPNFHVVEHSQSMQQLNNSEMNEEIRRKKEIARKRSVTLDKHLKKQMEIDSKNLTNTEDGFHRAESFQKAIRKGSDGSSIMKYLQEGKRSQSLDKNYMEWLQKTTPFASRSTSVTSAKSEAIGLSRSNSQISKDTLDDDNEEYNDDDDDDDDDDETFEKYVRKISLKTTSTDSGMTNEKMMQNDSAIQQSGNQYETNNNNVVTSKNEAEKVENKKFLKNKKGRKSWRFKSNKKKSSVKEETVIITPAVSSISLNDLNNFQPTIKPPLGLSPNKLNLSISEDNIRIRASSSSMTSLRKFDEKMQINRTESASKGTEVKKHQRNLSATSTVSQPDNFGIETSSTKHDKMDTEKAMFRSSGSRSSTLGKLFMKKNKERKCLDEIEFNSSLSNSDNSKPIDRSSFWNRSSPNLNDSLNPNWETEFVNTADSYMNSCKLHHGFHVTSETKLMTRDGRQSIDGRKKKGQQSGYTNKFATMTNLRQTESKKRSKLNLLDTNQSTNDFFVGQDEVDGTLCDAYKNNIDVSVGSQTLKPAKSLTLHSVKQKILPLYPRPSEQAVKAAQLFYRSIVELQPQLLCDNAESLHESLGQYRVLDDDLAAANLHTRSYVKGNKLITWLQELINSNQHCEEKSDVTTKNTSSRWQISGMWQVLFEEGALLHVTGEEQFQDKDYLYYFHHDIAAATQGNLQADISTQHDVQTARTSNLSGESVEKWNISDAIVYLQKNYPDALFRKALRQQPECRTDEELKMIYDEILQINALSQLSDSVKRKLAEALKFEFHRESKKVLFRQGEEGRSWYIILRGSVYVDVLGKGTVCTLREGDEFGNLAIENEAPRAATIILAEPDCHFMRVDKEDFVRILKDVEEKTIRLKEHDQDVLVLQKISEATTSTHRNESTNKHGGTIKKRPEGYTISAGKPERILEHILEYAQPWNTRYRDEALEDFILMHMVFMTNQELCEFLLKRYHSEDTLSSNFEKSMKRKVIYFVVRWSHIKNYLFETEEIKKFLQELKEEVDFDCVENHEYSKLKEEFSKVYSESDDDESNEIKRRFLNIDDCVKSYVPGGGIVMNREIRPNDEVLMKIHNLEKTYTTLMLPVKATAEEIIAAVSEKLNKPPKNPMLMEVQEGGNAVQVTGQQRSVATSINLNSLLYIIDGKKSKSTKLAAQKIKVVPGSHLDTVSSLEVAYHMTQCDWKQVNNIHVMEYVYKVFGASKYKAVTSNLDVFSRRFNQLAYWAPTEICSCQNLSKRAQLLRKFIKIAQHLKMYQNMNGFMAIMIGIGNQAISRLHATWDKLPAKYKKLVQEFEAILDPSRNHRAYRMHISSMDAPYIPYIPLVMMDMTFQHEGNKSKKNQLINFEKMHMISNSIRFILRGCHEPIEPNSILASTKTAEETKNYVENLRVITCQKTLNDLADKLEPKR